MVRTAAAAAYSLATMRERKKLGTAIAAMIRMIATTIKSSMSENPLFLGIGVSPIREKRWSIDFPPALLHFEYRIGCL
jgi:hypothetical protein